MLRLVRPLDRNAEVLRLRVGELRELDSEVREVKARDLLVEDLVLLDNVADNIAGRTICALGDAAAMPVQSFVRKFRDEFQYHIDRKSCLPGTIARYEVR